MVGMQRNKKQFWYALRVGSEDLLSKDGHKIGQRTLYGEIQEKKAAISEGAGNAVLTRFGLDTPNTRVIGPLDADCPIDAYAKVWIDTYPNPDENGQATTPNDYVVSDVQRSINHVMVVVRRTNNGASA